MGGFHFATGGALRAAPVAAFQPPSASPLATRAPSADWIGRRSWSSRFVPPRPGRVGSRVESHGWLSRRLPRPRRCATLAWGVGCEWRTVGNDTRSRVLGHRGSVGFLLGVMGCCARTVSCVGGGWRRDQRMQGVPANPGPGLHQSTCCPR